MKFPLITLGAGVGAAFLALSLAQSGAVAQQPPARPVSFFKDVRPILMKRCAGCHNSSDRQGKLSVVTYAALKSGGATGEGFVAGRPEDSPLYKMTTGKSPAMPKDGTPLAARDVATIKQWIGQGARDDTPLAKDPIDQEHPPVYQKPPVVTALAYSPDGETLAVSGYREILLHRADGTGQPVRLVGQSQRIESLAFSPDGKMLAAAGGDSCLFGEVQLWDVQQKKLVKSTQVGFDVLYGLSFSPDGKMVACGSAEKSAYLFSVPELQQLIKFDNHSDWVFGTTFSSDSKNFVTTSRDRAIKLVEIATKNFIDDINYQVYNGGYYAIARNPMKDEVAVGGDEGLIRYYSIYKKQARTMNREDYNLLRTFENVGGPIYALAFSPDGSLLAEGGRTSDVRIYKMADGTKAGTLKGFSGTVHSLAWNPKKPQLAVGGFDGSVRLYTVPTGELVKSFVPVPVTPQQRVAKGQ